MESTISYGYPYASARIQTGTNCSENKSTPKAFLPQQSPGVVHVLTPYLRQADIGPAGESVVPIPLRLAMANQDQLRHLFAKDSGLTQLAFNL